MLTPKPDTHPLKHTCHGGDCNLGVGLVGAVSLLKTEVIRGFCESGELNYER